VALSAALMMGALKGRAAAKPRTVPAIAAVVLGLLLAWGSIASSPPLPPAPTHLYDPEAQPLEMCRPPYRGE
jgi:hypothetical protein